MTRVLTSADIGQTFPTREGGSGEIVCDGLCRPCPFGVKITLPDGDAIITTVGVNGAVFHSVGPLHPHDIILPQPEPFKRVTWWWQPANGAGSSLSDKGIALDLAEKHGGRAFRVLVTEMPEPGQ